MGTTGRTDGIFRRDRRIPDAVLVVLAVALAIFLYQGDRAIAGLARAGSPGQVVLTMDTLVVGIHMARLHFIRLRAAVNRVVRIG